MRQIGGFSHLLEALEYAAGNTSQRLTWFDGQGNIQHTQSYGDVFQAAQLASAHLHAHLALQSPSTEARPLGPRIGVIATTGPDFLPILCACMRLGAIACPLPVLGPLQDTARYATTLQAMCQAAGIGLLIGPQAILTLLHMHGAVSSQRIQYLAFEAIKHTPNSPAATALGMHSKTIQPEDIAYVQFSSGSTGSPKGIAISHAALMHNVDAIVQHGMALQDSDRAFSWLPYYHDMGLVGFVLAPLCAQVSVDYLTPSSFARRPYLWLDLMAKRGSTITYAPNFAWRMAVQSAPHLAEDRPLNALRIAGVGGDYVDYPTLVQFADCFAKHGFQANAFKPSYGLAEATLAVTFCNAAFEQQHHDFVIHASTGKVEIAAPCALHSKSMVDCGPALPGWNMSIRNVQGEALPAMQEGQITLQGPAQMSGYFSGGTLHTMAKDQAIETGDKGFLTAAGTLVISGRSKDLIVIHGRNIWPRDIEEAVCKATGIPLEHQIFLQSQPEHAQAPQWSVFVHHKAIAKSKPSEVLKDIAAAATAAAGTSVQACIVANGTIVHTSSGKKARALSQERIHSR